MMKRFKDLNEAFVESLFEVNTYGSFVESRGTKQKELISYSMVIEDPTALSIDVPARKFKSTYATAEWLWYLSRSKSAKNIGKLASIWQRIADGREEVESNYGIYLLGEQWDWCKKELLRDPDSRRATMVINQPSHKGANPKDYPCTQYVQFFIRDRKLHLCVNMRSNDAVFGFCNDVFTFCLFQQLMLNDLNAFIAANGDIREERIELGHYYHHAGSFHVYESHWPMMNKVCQNYRAKAFSDGWPTLNKFKLLNTITTNDLSHLRLPESDMSKEEIREYTKIKMGEIYE